MGDASPEQEAAAERARLLRLAYAPRLIRFRRDIAWNLLDRLLDGPEPPASRWADPWRRAAWWQWRCFTALQAQRARLAA